MTTVHPSKIPSTSSSSKKPRRRWVLTESKLEMHRQAVAGFRQALIGRKTEEPHRFDVVLGHARGPLFVDGGEIMLCLGVSFVCGSPVALDRRRSTLLLLSRDSHVVPQYSRSCLCHRWLVVWYFTRRAQDRAACRDSLSRVPNRFSHRTTLSRISCVGARSGGIHGTHTAAKIPAVLRQVTVDGIPPGFTCGIGRRANQGSQT